MIEKEDDEPPNSCLYPLPTNSSNPDEENLQKMTFIQGGAANPQ
jgi:hypothetical protein